MTSPQIRTYGLRSGERERQEVVYLSPGHPAETLGAPSYCQMFFVRSSSSVRASFLASPKKHYYLFISSWKNNGSIISVSVSADHTFYVLIFNGEITTQNFTIVLTYIAWNMDFWFLVTTSESTVILNTLVHTWATNVNNKPTGRIKQNNINA